MLEERSRDDICEAIEVLCSTVWHYRCYQNLTRKERNEKVEAAARKVEQEIDNLGPFTNFEWGMINGKLSALRWVLGDEWDYLDT